MSSLDDLGWNDFFEKQLTEEERARFVAARVVWASRDHYRLSTGVAEWRARLAGRLRHGATPGVPAVGDWVLVTPRPGEGAATIRRCLVRRTAVTRAAAGRATERQVVAANVDTVLVVTSLNQDFNLRRLERYLALVWESGARPVIVLNKIDLCADREEWRAAVSSVAQGVPVLETSALAGDGIDDLIDTIRQGGTTVLLGSSGVGKSTLLNLLLRDRRQAVLPIRETDDRGRHSTTARQLFVVPGGGIVVDTPGLREVAPWEAANGIERAFADIDALAEQCRFRDCSHGTEPGCAVAAAAASGGLSPERLDSYRRLRREDEYLRARSDESARSQRIRHFKHIAKAIRLQARLRGR